MIEKTCERGGVMKSILTVVADGSARAALETAHLAAQRFKSHIVGLHVMTTEYAVVFGGEMGFSISSEVDRTLEREGQDRREQARRLFRDFMSERGVALGSAAGPSGVSAEWREEEGRQNAVVGALGRVFDLIVVERPPKLASLAEATLEDALFESGRPVMMAPPRTGPTMGETVVIAWNMSTETALTVNGATPFLKQAKDVRVISVETAVLPGPTAEELATALSRHGIKATARHVTTKASPGGVWLEECRAAGADLLIKGAYTQSRLRQMIFGGATREIIMEADLPVLMAH
jgi:nucleotide-binding universal stress UspA family protein